MTRLERSEVLKRTVRKDNMAEFGKPDLELVAAAIKAGKSKEALDFLEFAAEQGQRNTDSLVSFTETVLTHLAGFGEEELEKVFRGRYFPQAKHFLSVIHGAEDALRYDVDTHRRHHSIVTVKEEPDRFVMTCDPCGSGGRLRRTRLVGTTKKAYPWSWGKAGVPYYCTHCCLHWEIFPAELQGYPVKVILVADKPEDPCVHLFYKRPELIPEKYFTRIGMKRDTKKFKSQD